HGLINYQSQSAAIAANITEVRGDSLFLRVDTTPTALEGRSSNRITSKAAFGDGIYVLNVSHVPYGCSVWPAFWTVTVDYDTGAWPAGGEIDIIENANDQFSGDLVALHTNPGCTIPSTSSTQQASTQIQYTDCSGKTAQNTGCRMMLGSKPPTWGAPLNQAGGGLFVMRRDLSKGGTGISVWFFARGKEPSDLRPGSFAANPSGWGLPGAHFDIASTCASYFGPHYIVINTALAGDFAAATHRLLADPHPPRLHPGFCLLNFHGLKQQQYTASLDDDKADDNDEEYDSHFDDYDTNIEAFGCVLHSQCRLQKRLLPQGSA
ncbi:hypothetical protein OC846_005598, partial [Tilletia horrida]